MVKSRVLLVLAVCAGAGYASCQASAQAPQTQPPSGLIPPDSRAIIADWQAEETVTRPHFARDLDDYLKSVQKYVDQITAENKSLKEAVAKQSSEAPATSTTKQN